MCDRVRPALSCFPLFFLSLHVLDLLTILQFDGRQPHLGDVITVGVFRLDGQAGLGDHPVPQDHGGAAVLVAGPLAVPLRQRLKRRNRDDQRLGIGENQMFEQSGRDW